MTDERIQEIVLRYGYDAQSRQCIEEMAELTQAINKFWRKDLKCGYGAIEESGLDKESEAYINLIEEIADVEIMLEQNERNALLRGEGSRDQRRKAGKADRAHKEKADGKRGNDKRGSNRTTGKVQSARGSEQYKRIRHKSYITPV